MGKLAKILMLTFGNYKSKCYLFYGLQANKHTVNSVYIIWRKEEVFSQQRFKNLSFTFSAEEVIGAKSVFTSTNWTAEKKVFLPLSSRPATVVACQKIRNREKGQELRQNVYILSWQSYFTCLLCMRSSKIKSHSK